MSGLVPKFVGRDCELSTTGIDGAGVRIPNWEVTQRALDHIDAAFAPHGKRTWARPARALTGYGRYDGSGFGSSWVSAASSDCLRHWGPNGQCFYSDMSHLEVCTAETRQPGEVAAQSWAALKVAEAARRRAEEAAPGGTRYLLSAANVDLSDPGISWGSHLSVSIAPALFDDLVVDPARPGVLGFVASAFAAAIPFFGSGYLMPLRDGSVAFSLSARAHHITRICTMATTQAFARGLLNARREAHGTGIERLHLIGFDFSPIASALMVSFVQCVLAAAELGHAGQLLSEPLQALHAWSLGFDAERGKLVGTAALADGRQLGLPEYVREVATALLRLVESGAIPDAVAPGANVLLPRIVELTERLGRGELAACSRHLDWTAKLLVLLAHCERTGEALSGSPARLLDHDFASTDPSRGVIWKLLERGRIDPMFEAARIDACLRDGPDDSRGFTRGRLVQRFGDAIAAIDWDHVELELVDARFGRRLRIDMPDPGALARAATEGLLASAHEVGDLAELAALGACGSVSTKDPLRDLRGELSLPGEPRGDCN